MDLAFNSKHPHVPKTNRWIASLSDGSTVFEDITPAIESAWLRLRKYLAVHKLKITNLRLEAYDRRVVLVPYKDDDGNRQVDGYWYSKRQGLFFGSGLIQEFSWIGIGVVQSDVIYVTWISDRGDIETEIKERKSGDLACIINEV